MSQRELAEPRYTAAFVSSLEAGKRTASVEALEYFAQRLAIAVDELRTGRAADHWLRLELALAVAEAAGAPGAFRELLGSEGLSDEQQAWCHVGIGHAALATADLAEAGIQFESADHHLVGAAPHHRAHATVGRAAVLRRQGDARYAVYLLTEARDELTRTGYPDPSALLALHVHLAVAHSDLGDDVQAAEAAESALLLASGPRPMTIARGHLDTGRTLLAAGRLPEAAVAVGQARAAFREATLHSLLAWCHRARGLRRKRDWDREGALTDLTMAERLFAESGQDDRRVDTALELAELRLAMGIAEPDLPVAGNPVQQARADRLRALMASDGVAKEQFLVAAIGGFRDRGPRPELARAVNELADLLEAAGRGDEALRVLRAGLADVQRLNSQT
ncbi:helix-turn-helix transcriptional regulator [Catenulispora yoronensis]|uniref:Helix-turn-helix transcriptional regulator n=2 Tax=Catenulispora yoronensis TaxID=450799 RepID=A0ABP5FKB5_9ACTN